VMLAITTERRPAPDKGTCRKLRVMPGFVAPVKPAHTFIEATASSKAGMTWCSPSLNRRKSLSSPVKLPPLGCIKATDKTSQDTKQCVQECLASSSLCQSSGSQEVGQD